MRTTRQLSVTLADDVRARVVSGEYASESEVIRDGLRALRARDRAVDQWLRGEAGPALDAYRADPSRGIHLDDMRGDLDRRHDRATRSD